MTRTLFYVSKSTLRFPEEAGVVDAIVSVARARNSALEVTGALVFTQTHFAQCLEGPGAALDEVMNSIVADPRHCEVDIILDGPAPVRRFHGWSMAYAGPSVFVRSRIDPLLGAQEGGLPLRREQAARNLIYLMSEFAGQSG